MNNAKKVLLSLGVVGVFIAYSWHQRNEDSTNPLISTKTGESKTPAKTSAPMQPVHVNSPSMSPGSSYKDGTYTGSSQDAFYGFIQVQAVIKDGKIVDVVFLEYPNDQQNSVAINMQAMPFLKQEALAAQSSNVDVVSGATDTSQAFVQSLADALNQAKRA